MAGFCSTPSPFIKLNNKVGFIALFLVFSSAQGWWRILKLASTEQPWPRSSCMQKGWITSPSDTALFSPS